MKTMVKLDSNEMKRMNLSKKKSSAFAQNIIDRYCNSAYYDEEALEN